MQFASLRDFRLNAASILRRAKNTENIIVTRRGKPVAILVPTDEAMFDGVLRAIQGARLRASLERLQAEAKRKGSDKMTLAQINAEIRKARAGKGD